VLLLASLSSHLLFDVADHSVQQLQQIIGKRLKPAVLSVSVGLLAVVT